MVKLFCAVVGEESIVTVDIEEQQAVGDLKERIKRRAGYDFPSHKLTLYLAKENGDEDGQWMTTEHADYVRLSRGGAGVEATYLTTDTRDATGKIVRKGTLMDPTWGLHNYFDANTPSEKVIHVLVKLPDDTSTAINVPGEGSPLLGREVARTTNTGGKLRFHLICVKTTCCILYLGRAVIKRVLRWVLVVVAIVLSIAAIAEDSLISVGVQENVIAITKFRDLDVAGG